jgi:hypothetical protein
VRLSQIKSGRGTISENGLRVQQEISPSLFPREDAKHFTEYLQHEKMAVPHLSQVAHFELAVIGIQSGDLAVTVRFTCDPQLLLASLAAGDLPKAMVLEDHEITIHP